LNALSLAAGVLALLGGWPWSTACADAGHSRYPTTFGPIELSAFVAAGSALQLLGGQPASAAFVAGANLAALAVLYLVIAFGIASILGFTVRRLRKQLAVAVGLLARAIPLLLLFSMVLFVNTEMWQVFSGIDDPTLTAVMALLAAVAAGFVAVRLPREVIRLEEQVAAEPRLTRRQRTNVGLVLFVSQTLQVAVVAVAIGAFFVAFGALAIGPATATPRRPGQRARRPDATTRRQWRQTLIVGSRADDGATPVCRPSPRRGPLAAAAAPRCPVGDAAHTPPTWTRLPPGTPLAAVRAAARSPAAPR